MVIKWILLDAWGVIYTPRNFIDEVLIPFIRQMYPKIDENHIYKHYFEASVGLITSKEIWRALGLEKQYPDIEHQYINFHESILDPDFKPIVKILKQSFKLGLISNDVKEWSFALLDKFDIKKDFESIYINGDVKIRKPDIKIFQKFIDETRSIPEECLFVDDRLENLKVAAELGMHPIRFIRREAKVSFCSEFEISCFFELSNVLDNFFS